MKSICIFCGSSPGKNPVYEEDAVRTGVELQRRDITLVYGGACIGVMGKLADTVLEKGGKVTGVIPEALNNKVAHPNLTELHVVKTMHQRKALMFKLSDAFIALPGGLGTFEELFEMLTWAQLRFHTKPCGILNSNGYYDKLKTFLDHAVEEGFVKREHRDILIFEKSPAALIEKLKEYRPPELEKWME